MEVNTPRHTPQDVVKRCAALCLTTEERVMNRDRNPRQTYARNAARWYMFNKLNMTVAAIAAAIGKNSWTATSNSLAWSETRRRDCDIFRRLSENPFAPQPITPDEAHSLYGKTGEETAKLGGVEGLSKALNGHRFEDQPGLPPSRPRVMQARWVKPHRTQSVAADVAEMGDKGGAFNWS